MRRNINDVLLVFLLFSVSGAIDGYSVLVDDCSTEGVECENIGDNLIDSVIHVPTLEECRQLCLDVVNCSFISYFDESASPVSNFCEMFTTCDDTVKCENCISGPVDCSAAKCSLALDGEENTSLMLNKTGQTHNVTITGWGSCHLNFLLVGGGGNEGGYDGGAGSGYLEYQSLQVPAGTVLTAQVGDQRQSSSVTLSSGDTYTANPGQDGHGFDGGDGYSGGGGGGWSSGSAGGTNGGDGHGGSEGSGGHGTGEDVSSFTFISWNIKAGAGGEVVHSSSGYGYGGGGGGVMNGQGPQSSPYKGQGYGGGGSGFYSYGDGMSGVILTEIN